MEMDYDELGILFQDYASLSMRWNVACESYHGDHVMVFK